jgi:4-amino-4-deoxy-L-arabinose transferase-like glycosyltransferase
MRGPDRASAWPLLLLVAAALASLAFLVHPWYEATPETADASIYLLCAKSLLAGDGYSVLGQPFTVRPPGFSILLAPVLALRGLDFLALNVYVSLFGVAAVALLYVLARPRIGTLPALALAVLVWLNPTFRHLSNEVLSDLPGLVALLGCLLVERWAARRSSVRRDVVLGCAVGLATYVRSLVGLVAVAAVLARVGEIRERGFVSFVRARALALAAVAFGLAAPWFVRNAVHHPPWPAEQTVCATYGAVMWHTDQGDPASPRVPVREFLARPLERAPQILLQLGSRLDPEATGAVPTVLGAILVAAMLAVAVRRRGVPEITGLLTFLVLVFLPVPPEVRHVLPVFVLGALAVADVLVGALGRAFARGRSVATVAILVLACVDCAPRRGFAAISAAYAADRDLAARVASRLAPTDRVAAPLGWHWSLYLDRPVYNLHIQARRMGTAGIDQVIRDHAIDAVILRVDPPETPNTTAYLEAKHGAGEAVGPMRIVRIRK